MGSYYTNLQICAAMFLSIVLSFFPKAEGGTTKHLEWQLPIDGHSYSSVTVRASTEKQGIQEESFTGEVTISGKTGQAFIVCAERLSSENFYLEASAAVTPVSSDSDERVNIYALTLSEEAGKLTIVQGQPCPEHFKLQYPIASEQHIRSEKPFFVESKRSAKDQDNQNSDVITPASFPITPKSLASRSGGGYGIDDQNDFKRPPFMLMPDKAMANLILLPTMNLPADWREYRPFTGLYHWLTDTGHEGVTILVRFDNMPVVTLRISQAESRELAGNILNARQLLHWLAPRLSGREQLIQQLLDLSADSDEQPSPLSEETLESIRKHLAIVLEQPDTEFSLAFEYSELARNLNRQNKTQSPPGIIQLGTTQSTTTHNAATGGGTGRQGRSGIPASNQDGKKTKKEPAQYPAPDTRHNEFTDYVFAGAEYYTVRLHQTEYRISKWQVLAHLDKPVSEADLRLSCQDCQQGGISLQDMLPHAETHQLTCDQCQQFQPTAGTVEARRRMLLSHTQSQCNEYKGEVQTAPLTDESLSLFRFMIRFGTEESLLDLLQQFDLSVVAEDLRRADRYQRIILHDLAQYASPEVVKAFLERFRQWITVDLLQRSDRYGWTPMHYLFQCQPEQTIIETIQNVGQLITHELLSRQNHRGSTLLHTLYHRALFPAVAEVFRGLRSQGSDPFSQGLLAIQDASGVNLLHILFACGDDPLIYDFIDRLSHRITSAELGTETLNGETPLHPLFEQVSASAIIRLIDASTIHFNSELLRKKRASDGYTPAHLLFARGDVALTRIFLDSRYHHIDRTLATTTNNAGVSVLQVLLQHSLPAVALPWLHQGNPEHKAFLKATFGTKPDIEWPELLNQARQHNQMTPQLHWVMKELESVSIEEFSVEPSAPILESSAPPIEPLASLSLDPRPSAPPEFMPEKTEPEFIKADIKDKRPVTPDAAMSEIPKPREVIKITEKSGVTDDSGENQLHKIARESSLKEIAAIFGQNAETITPAMLSADNIAGCTPFHILVDRGISPSAIFPWFLHGLKDAVAKELLDQNRSAELSWQQIYDYARVSSYVEKDQKLKQILELLEPILGKTPDLPEAVAPAAPPTTKIATGATAYMECPICSEPMEENCALTPCCDQIFHRQCIERWVGKNKNPCSHCREFLDVHQLRNVRAPLIVVEKGDEPEVIDVRPKVKPEETGSAPDGANGSGSGTKPDINVPPTDEEPNSDTSQPKAKPKEREHTASPPPQPSAYFSSGVQPSTIFVVNPAHSQEKVWTPLHQAAKEGNIERIKQLIRLGADPNAVEEKKTSDILESYLTPVGVAAAYGKAEALQILIDEYGVSPYFMAGSKHPVIGRAAREGQIEIIQLLIDKYGVDPNAGPCPAVGCAVIGKHIDVVRLLIEHYGVSPNTTCSLRVFDEPLVFLAVSSGSIPLTKLLVEEYHVNPHTLSKHGTTVWNQAFSIKADKVVTEMVLLLLGYGVSPHVRGIGSPILTFAAGHGDIDLIKMLIDKYGLDPHEDDESALSNAAYCGKIDVVRLLIEQYKAKPQIGTVSEALHGAVHSGNADLVKLLINKYHVNPHATDCFGYTILHAVNKDDHKLRQMIINDYGVTVEREEKKKQDCFLQ